jgi:hypothetical protein
LKDFKINNVYDKLVYIMKIELDTDNYKRFNRTKEYYSILEKYKDDENVVETYKQQIYPYTINDFYYPISKMLYIKFLVTEKDIAFLDESVKDSYDFKFVKTIKKNNIKSSAFVSINCEKFLPNFFWSKKACGI